MLSRYSRIPTIVVLVLAIIALVFYGIYISAQNPSVEIEIGKNAVDVMNQITGLDELSNVQITANAVTIAAAADDTPLLPVRQKLINRPLWKVSYQIDVLQHHNTVNPHIVGFDAYIDTSTGQLLKIVSRDAPGLPEKYRTGIRVSNPHIASSLDRNRFWVPDSLPLTAPSFRFVDMLKGNGLIARHYECYYFLYKQKDVEGGAIIPAWLIIRYGTERFFPLGPSEHRPAVLPSLAEKYARTFRLSIVDATSGETLRAFWATSANEDTFN